MPDSLEKPSALISWSLLFACNLMWALQFTCIKLVQDQVGPLATVWIPTTLSVFMLLPIVRAERRHAHATMRPPLRGFSKLGLLKTYLLLVFLGVVPGQLLMTFGTRLSLASNSAMISLALPVTTALFAVLFLKERMTSTRWISFGLALGGVVLASGGTLRQVRLDRSQLLGNLLVFMAILGSSFYNSYGKKALEVHTPIEMLFWTYLLLSICMAPFVFVLEAGSLLRVTHFTWHTCAGLGSLTIFHTFLAMVLFLKALKHLDAIQAALSNYLIALFGIPIAALWLGERLTTAAIAGGILILGSTVLMAFLDHARENAVSHS
jgi:drug/metabolite transporter (DMT)-like permease